MADISTELAAILSAVYGRDVRQAIHDGIKAANDSIDDFVQGNLDTALTSTTLPAQGKAAGDAVTTLDGKSTVHRGQVPQADDINAYYTPGQWYASTNTPSNWPWAGVAGRMLVFGSTGSNLYTKMQIVVGLNGQMAVRIGNGSGAWNAWINFKDFTGDITAVQTAINALSKTAEYEPEYSWEQGTFTTSSWSKGKSSASNYNKFIRFVDYPSLAGVRAVRLTVPDGYKVYFGCRGWSAAKTYEASTTVELADSDRTELSLSLYHGNAVIQPSEGAGVKVHFIPYAAAQENAAAGIRGETDGIIIRDEDTPVKVGIYGASIVAGYGVSDYSNHHDGTTIDLSTIGYSKSETRYTGDKSWPQMLKAYLETYFPNVTVTNWAISGATASNYYSYLKKSQENNNAPIDTDVDIAIIMMGNNGRNASMATNIAAFANIINVFRDSGAKVYFMTPTAAFNTSEAFVINTYQIMHCAKAAAEDAGICAVDAFSWIEEYCAENGISLAYDAQAEKNFLNSDNLHPNDLGHEVIYKAVKQLLKV